jgi:hypothetical protein
MAHRPLRCYDGSWRAWGGEPVRNTQGMVPEPTDDPKPDDEPDDEPDGEPDEEPDDKPDDEPDEEPEPGTLYFGEDNGCTAQSCCSPTSRPGRQPERTPRARRIRFLYEKVHAPRVPRPRCSDVLGRRKRVSREASTSDYPWSENTRSAFL